ncbi:MAG: hypothetical protein ABL957_05825, partial [Parvularculaceae bacterium]
QHHRRPAMMLHARRISLPISKSRPPVVVAAPPPAPMAAFLAEHGFELEAEPGLAPKAEN